MAIATRASWLLFTGTAIAGSGFGPAFSGAYRTIIVSATEEDRAELVAATYTMSYTALGVPALAAGIAATHYGLRDTALVYAVGVALLAASALAGLIVRRIHDSGRHATAVGRAVPVAPGPCTIPPCLPIDTGERIPQALSS